MDLKKLTDEDLMHRFQEGDINSYNEIVERYKDKLLNHLFYFVKSKELAEDIVQDALVRVYLNKEKYKDIAKVSTWIYTIANNLAKTQLTKLKKADVVSITQDEGERDLEIKDTKASTDNPILRKELGELVMEAIENLDDKFREIIIMRDIDELSYDEIASIMNIPVGTVKSRINRARLTLRSDLENYLE